MDEVSTLIHEYSSRAMTLESSAKIVSAVDCTVLGSTYSVAMLWEFEIVRYKKYWHVYETLIGFGLGTGSIIFYALCYENRCFQHGMAVT
jgi:hypothetical protein